jgi:hypothetical protein
MTSMAAVELSHSLSPWLYMLIAVGIVTWGIVSVWGRKDGGSRTWATSRENSP